MNAIHEENDATKTHWDRVIDLLLSCKTQEDLNRFFDFILTHDERDMISKRLALTQALLLKEKSQRQIAEDLSLSIALITRGSNELKRTSSENISWIKKLLKIN
jgi:TrpR family trp operon transcriptional repressor